MAKMGRPPVGQTAATSRVEFRAMPSEVKMWSSAAGDVKLSEWIRRHLNIAAAKCLKATK